MRIAVLFVALAPALWGTPDPAPTDADDLLGTWQVDLRPTPDAEPYLQVFTVSSTGNSRLSGNFYGSDITNGRTNSDWGAIHFAFVTRDGSGTYHTAGVLKDGEMSGTTHSLGRDFLSVWTAKSVE